MHWLEVELTAAEPKSNEGVQGGTPGRFAKRKVAHQSNSIRASF